MVNRAEIIYCMNRRAYRHTSICYHFWLVQELVAGYPTIDHYTGEPWNDLGGFCDGMVPTGDPQDGINKDGCHSSIHNVFA